MDYDCNAIMRSLIVKIFKCRGAQLLDSLIRKYLKKNLNLKSEVKNL